MSALLSECAGLLRPATAGEERQVKLAAACTSGRTRAACGQMQSMDVSHRDSNCKCSMVKDAILAHRRSLFEELHPSR